MKKEYLYLKYKAEHRNVNTRDQLKFAINNSGGCEKRN